MVREQEGGPCPVPYLHQLPELPSMAYSMSWGWLGVVVGTAVWLQQVPLAVLRLPTQAPCCGPGDTASSGTPT